MRSPCKVAKNKKIKNIFINKKKQSIEPNISFKIHRYNTYDEYRGSIFFSCLSEFGCESLLPTFLLPRIAKNFPDKKKIVLGWQGREYFYKHIVDEFWEIDPLYMKFRANCKAFMHNTKELKLVENHIGINSPMVEGRKFGNLCLTSVCLNCDQDFVASNNDITCMHCGSQKTRKSLFQGYKEYKKHIKYLPVISSKYANEAYNIIPSNSVALFARNRKTYGRNFDEAHYQKIVDFLNDMGYNVVLLGEPVSSLSFKHSNVLNLLNHKYAGNLEFAFSVVDRCKFSLQFYTASTRISSLLRKKFVLVESPDQIYGRGQEGVRLALMTMNESDKKLILSNYINTLENFDNFLIVLQNSIYEFIENNNYKDVFYKCENTKNILKTDNLW